MIQRLLFVLAEETKVGVRITVTMQTHLCGKHVMDDFALEHNLFCNREGKLIYFMNFVFSKVMAQDLIL